MDIFLYLTLIPLIGIVSPIYLSFDKEISYTSKIYLFLFMPAVEILFLVISISGLFSDATIVTKSWQLYILTMSLIIGLCLTLIVALVEDIEPKVKLCMRLTALSILSFATVWGITA